MSFKKTIIAIVVLALAAAAYLFLEKPRVKHGAEEKESKEKVLAVDWDNVDEIKLQQPGAEIDLKKGPEDAWKVVKPFEDDADKFAVQGLISAVRSAKPDRVLDKPEALFNYGLSEPRLTATFTSKGVSGSLLLGASHQIGDSVFAKRADAASVLVLPGTVYTALAKPAESFRDKTIIQAAWGDPDRIELSHSGETVWMLASEKTAKPAAENPEKDDLAAASETTWKIESPSPWWRAGRKTVDDVLRGIRDLRVEDVLKEKPDELAARGLEPPRISLRLHYPDGREVKMEIGDKFGDLGYFQAVSPKGFLVTVKADPIKKIDVDLETLKDKTLVNFNVSDVLTVELHRPSTSITITRSSGGDFTSEGASLDSEKVLGDLRRLVDLSGKSFLEGDELTAARAALANPDLSLKLLGAGDKVLAEIKFAKVMFKGTNETTTVAVGNLTDSVYKVESGTPDEWPASLEGWKSSGAAKTGSKDGQPESEKNSENSGAAGNE